jgi:antirestriction protein ArdC
VSIPVARRFETAEDYYSTIFHELGHSTGHESRLNRLASTKHRSFGSEDYSFEELVAEMTAAFLCVHCGIENQVKPSASYIHSWLAVLRQDRKILLDAATAAQKATDHILGCCLVAERGEDQAE